MISKEDIDKLYSYRSASGATSLITLLIKGDTDL